jgi:hypothetical protein
VLQSLYFVNSIKIPPTLKKLKKKIKINNEKNKINKTYILITMTDIAEIELKIKAVEFALRSYSRFSDEQQRKDHLRSQYDNVQNLDTYFGFSEFELKDALNKLQDEKNLLLLLALQQGGVFICECLNLQ